MYKSYYWNARMNEVERTSCLSKSTSSCNTCRNHARIPEAGDAREAFLFWEVCVLLTQVSWHDNEKRVGRDRKVFQTLYNILFPLKKGMSVLESLRLHSFCLLFTFLHRLLLERNEWNGNQNSCRDILVSFPEEGTRTVSVFLLTLCPYVVWPFSVIYISSPFFVCPEPSGMGTPGSEQTQVGFGRNHSQWLRESSPSKTQGWRIHEGQRNRR